MWKKRNRKREGIRFLTSNLLCSLQEKGRSSDYVIIPRNRLRSWECTVRLWLWPSSSRKCSPKSCSWECLGQITKAFSSLSSCVIPGQKASRQLIDGIWLKAKPYGSNRGGAQLRSLVACTEQREGRQRLPRQAASPGILARPPQLLRDKVTGRMPLWQRSQH